MHDTTQLVGAGISRILKLARTIADLAGNEEIQFVQLAALPVCFAKALQYRLKLMLN